MFRNKLPISDSELERLCMLAWSLRGVGGAQTVNRVADLSDSMLEMTLAATKQRGRRKAIRSMWEVEEWLSEK